jgi:MFS family permease
MLLLVALVIREKPADMGLEPLGSASRAAAPAGAPDGLPYGTALRTRSFWAMALAATTTFYAVLAATAHLFLYLRGLDFDQQKASLGISLLFAVGLVGKFGFGFLADHLNQRRVFYGNVGVMWAGSVLLATMDTGLVWIAIVVFSLGWGGLYTLLHLITVDSFGLRAAGKILGTIAVFEAVGGGFGIWVTGLLYDKTGSYQVPFVVMSVLIFLALIAATQVRRQVGAVEEQT